MLKMNNFNCYEPLFEPIGIEPVYYGEFYGMSHEDAKKLYETFIALGFYDDVDFFGLGL